MFPFVFDDTCARRPSSASWLPRRHTQTHTPPATLTFLDLKKTYPLFRLESFNDKRKPDRFTREIAFFTTAAATACLRALTALSPLTIALFTATLGEREFRCLLSFHLSLSLIIILSLCVCISTTDFPGSLFLSFIPVSLSLIFFFLFFVS